MTPRGRLVVFEGVDGCGKTVQVRRVAEARGALATFEPGDTQLGAALRAVVLDPDTEMTALAEVLVMAADRAQHVAEVIEPTLAAGRDVVCDRFSGSTLAYQGFGRGVDVDLVRLVVDAAAAGCVPDVTVLLDCAPELARSRRERRAGDVDRFEGSDAGFAVRVRDGFLALAAETPSSWRVVDASQSLERVAHDVDVAIAEVLG